MKCKYLDRCAGIRAQTLCLDYDGDFEQICFWYREFERELEPKEYNR